MGKTRKNKSHSAKVNPIGIPSVRDVQIDEELLFGEEGHPEGPIAAMVEQLNSISIEEKMCALQALSFMCQNQQRINEIIESDIVKTIASWLMDRNHSIRNATAGALRNLSLCGVEICENLVDQDVLTPLLALLHEYALNTDWVPVFDKSLNSQLDERSDTFLQAINLVWTLCESTSLALENFNQTRVVDSFVRYLNYEIFGFDISIAVGQCLLVISEDNPVAWRILSNYREQLVNFLTNNSTTTTTTLTNSSPHSSVLLSTLVAGIMSNVPALSSSHFTLIFTALCKSLDVNHRQILGNFTSLLPATDERSNIGGGRELFITEDSEAMEDETEVEASLRRRRQDLPTEIEIELKNVGWLLEAQRVAAETITNFCSTDDDDSTGGNGDIDDNCSDAESVHDYDIDSAHSSANNLQNTDKLPLEILEAIKSLGLVEKLWQKAQPIAENVVDILKINDSGLIKKINTLRISSLLCLQNLCNVMTTEDLGGPSAIYSVWLDLGQQVFQGSQNPDILEASTALMRSALEHLRQNTELFAQMTENDLQLMLNGVQECAEPEIRANWLRMLGLLGGCLLPEILVKKIISFILETCLKESDAWTISEAVDALMDMFSDNDWDQISYELNLVQKSNELLRQLKNKLKQQKRELAERYPAVCTVRTNLIRFTKYMEEQQRKYKPVVK